MFNNNKRKDTRNRYVDVNFQHACLKKSNSKIFETFLDTENIVRRSKQYHSANIGYI